MYQNFLLEAQYFVLQKMEKALLYIIEDIVKGAIFNFSSKTEVGGTILENILLGAPSFLFLEKLPIAANISYSFFHTFPNKKVAENFKQKLHLFQEP